MTNLNTSNQTRRRLIAGGAALLAGAGLSRSVLAQAATIDLPMINGRRNMGTYPEKRPLIVLTSRPPQLETPFSVFNEGIMTPNDAFFVRYHHAGLVKDIDGDKHVIKIGGNACDKPFELTMSDLRTKFTPVEVVAVKQCSGNSRGFSNPRVPGGQSGNGTMGNASWVGVPLKDILARAGVNDNAKQVTFNGLDLPMMGAGAADFIKALEVDHAMDGEVMVAYQMNGAELPMLNGYPVVLVVPGYYGTYWVKHLSEIQIIDKTFEGFWMNPAYRIPDNDCACMEPGSKGPGTRPIGRLNVRSFVTSVQDGGRLNAGQMNAVRGIAFDGGQGIREVAYSVDGGHVWREATLGKDLGRYSFREFTFGFNPEKGAHDIRVRAWNRSGQSQPMDALWNPSGYMRNAVESTKITAV